MRLPGIFALATLPFLLSCGGGGGASAPAPAGVAAPTNLRTIPGPDRDHFTLRWDAPVGNVNGLNLEARVGTGNWGKLNSSLLPPELSGVEISFPSQAPEDIDYEFRMNAEWGGAPSAYSNTVQVHRGLRAPGQATGAYDWNRGGIALIWVRNSAISTGVQIERRPVDADGNPTGSWVVLPAPEPGATAYLDSGAAPGVYYAYRITNTRDTLTSAPGPTSTPLFTGLPAPSWPTVAYDFTALGMNLSWKRNTAFADGIRIERQVATVNGDPLGSWTLLTPSDPGADTYFDGTVTPNTFYVYRITNLRGGVPGLTGPSSVPTLAGLPPAPSVSANWDLSRGGIYVHWYGSSPSPFDSYRLERAPCEESGQLTGPWGTMATFPVPANTYNFDFIDTTAAELTYYRYRVIGIRGNLSQEGPPASRVATFLYAPTDLKATVTGEGIQLSWQNHSQVATQITLSRGSKYNQSPIAVLSASSTSYLDPNPPLGYYTYQVVAEAGARGASSSTVTVATPNPPSALNLIRTDFASPAADHATLRPSGTWAFLTTQPFGILSNGDPWQPIFPNNLSGQVYSPLRVDAAGWPHAVYPITDPQNKQNRILMHLWTDGASWQSEPIASYTPALSGRRPDYDFQLDITGTPHVLLDQATPTSPFGGSTNTLKYFHKVNGSWTSRSLEGIASPTSLSLMSNLLVLDGQDLPHILLRYWSSILEITPDGLDGWTTSTLPAGAVEAWSEDFLAATWTDRDTATVAFERLLDSGDKALIVLQKVGGVWGSPVQVGTRARDASPTTAALAQSPDRSRAALLYHTNLGLKAYHQTSGAWIETLVAPPMDNFPWIKLGLDGANRIRILTKGPDGFGFTDYHEP